MTQVSERQRGTEVESAALAAVRPVLRPLGYTGRVRLLDGSGPAGRAGPWSVADRTADAAGTYLALGVDAPLKGFREQAGRSAPGASMAGWAARTSEATFGQWVSGLARLGAVLDDDVLRGRAVELAHGWAETLPVDGDARMATYGWEKIVCGLVDVAAYAEDRQALDVLVRVVEAAGRTFDRTRPEATPHDRDGRRPHGALEWYTLAENVYRGYLLTGEPRLREFAELWHYDRYWDAFASPPAPGRPWDVPVWRHAYSHVNTFASLGERYRVDGDPGRLAVLRHAHAWVTGTQCYATGGYGPGEWSLPDDGSLGTALEWRSDTAEITCGSWAAFKLSSQLLTLTGEAHYGDWPETLLYSGLGAATPVRPDGETPYYADYRLGTATKLPHWDAWPCCSGSYLQAVAHLADLIWFEHDDGLAVNLFVASDVTLERDGVRATVRQTTDFPAGNRTTFTVRADRPLPMALRLRVPAWSSGLTVRRHGREVPVRAQDGWLVVDRVWEPGDSIEVDLGAGLRALPVDAAHPHRVAFAHGPVVLAQDAVFTSPLAAPNLQVLDLDALLVPGAEPLRYRPAWSGAAEQPVAGLLPLADVPPRRPYRVYHDLDRPRVI